VSTFVEKHDSLSLRTVTAYCRLFFHEIQYLSAVFSSVNMHAGTQTAMQGL